MIMHAGFQRLLHQMHPRQKQPSAWPMLHACSLCRLMADAVMISTYLQMCEYSIRPWTGCQAVSSRTRPNSRAKCLHSMGLCVPRCWTTRS